MLEAGMLCRFGGGLTADRKGRVAMRSFTTAALRTGRLSHVVRYQDFGSWLGPRDARDTLELRDRPMR